MCRPNRLLQSNQMHYNVLKFIRLWYGTNSGYKKRQCKCFTDRTHSIMQHYAIATKVLIDTCRDEIIRYFTGIDIRDSTILDAEADVIDQNDDRNMTSLVFRNRITGGIS